MAKDINDIRVFFLYFILIFGFGIIGIHLVLNIKDKKRLDKSCHVTHKFEKEAGQDTIQKIKNDSLWKNTEFMK